MAKFTLHGYLTIMMGGLLCAVIALSLSSVCFAGQVPSHIYTADNIRKANSNIEKYIAGNIDAYMAGANGPDTANIMSYLAPGGMGKESHYDKTGDLPIAMLVNAKTDREIAYAIGWMTHWINDYFVHALVNQWGGWFEVADKHHKSLEMLESKYIFSAKNIRSYSPPTIPADTTITGCDAVFEAFKECFPKTKAYQSKTAMADWRTWFFRSTGVIRTASGSFMTAADDGTGVNSAWTTWAAFPNMPSKDQYANINKFAEVTETTATKPMLTVKVKVYDNKMFKWFLKQWDGAQAAATQYSVQVCNATTGYLNSTDEASKKDYLAQLHAVLPNVSLDQPRDDFDNSKIYPGNVNATEVYYECELIDTTNGGKRTMGQKGTEPIKLSGKKAGFDGSDTGEIVLEIPVDCDSYKYNVKVSLHGKEPLADPDLKDYAWVGVKGVFGAEVKIDGDDTTKAAAPLKLKATVTADPKTEPLVKLRWTDETNKKKLGEGDTISFVSNEIGEFSIKAEAYIVENGKEMVLSDDTIEVEVTEPEVTLVIEGDTTIEPNKPLKLKANVTAEPAIKKALEIRWTDDTGKISYGKGETINFTQKTPGSYPIRAEAFWMPKPKTDLISVGSDSKKITVSNSPIKVTIQGVNKAKPDELIELKAAVEANKDILPKLRCIWYEGATALVEGDTLSYSSREEKAHKITVIVLGKLQDEEEELARTEHEITVAKEDVDFKGVTADLQGMKSEVIKGGSIEINAVNFRDAKGALGIDKNKFKIVWQSDPASGFAPKETINNEKTSVVASGKEESVVSVWGDILLEKDGKFVPVGTTAKSTFTIIKNKLSVKLEATKTTIRPGDTVDVLAVVGGYGVREPFKYVWTGDHASGSKDNSKVTFTSRKNGKHVLSVEVTDKDGLKGTASIAITVLGVTATLEGVPDEIIYGQKAPLSVKVEGLDKLQEAAKSKNDSNKPPQEWVLTSIERNDEKASGPTGYEVFETSTHSDTALNATHHHPRCGVAVNASWGMPPTKVKPGETIKIPWSLSCVCGEADSDGTGYLAIYAEGESFTYDDKSQNWHHTGYGKPKSQSGTYEWKFAEGIPGKTFKITVKASGDYAADGSVTIASNQRVFVYTFAGENAIEVKQPARIIWQSEPGITFDPATSDNYKTTALFDRMDVIKIWAEVLIPQDGDYVTVGETDQMEVTVKPPQFKLTFEPAEGQGKVGQEIKATITTEPAVEKSLIEYAWTEPASANRMPYEQNESIIGFKAKDTNPVKLQATARVPTVMDIIGEITGSYIASAFTVKAEVIGTPGPKPQIWKEGVGLVTVGRDTYCSDEQVRVKATIEGEGVPSEVRWKWTANEGTSIGMDIAQEITVTRHETGTAELTVEARNKDGVLLGKATCSFSVTVSADQLKDAKDKSNIIELTLTVAPTDPKLGDTVKFTATAKGGKAPYTYTWQGGPKGQGASATMVASEAGQQDIVVAVKDSSGKTTAKSITINVVGAFDVTLTSDKTSLKVNETATIKAVAKGGKAPYTYKWFANGVEGQGSTVKFTAPETGQNTITVVVVDAKQKNTKKHITITVEDLVPIISNIPDSPVFGTESLGECRYQQSPAGSKVNVKPLPIIVWHTEPEVAMGSPRTNTPLNRILWDRMGQVEVWVEVINSKGKLLGKTEPKTVTVVAPQFTMTFDPATSKSGDPVNAKIVIPDNVRRDTLDFEWVSPQTGRAMPSSPEIYRFIPEGKDSAEVVAKVKTKKTGELVAEVRGNLPLQSSKGSDKDKTEKISESGKPGESTPSSKPGESAQSDKPGESGKTDQPADKTDKPAVDEKAISDKDAQKKLEQAQTLSANGKIEEAVAIVDEIAKTNPEKAAESGKKVATYAASFSMNSVVDLNFEQAVSRVDAALRLDPQNAKAKENQPKILLYKQNWEKAQELREEMDAQIAQKKIPSADKTLAKIRELIQPIPAAPNTSPWFNALSQAMVGHRQAYTDWLQPIRKQIMDYIKLNAHENALPLVNEGMKRELMDFHQKEFDDWKKLCEEKIAERQGDAKEANSWFVKGNSYLEKSNYKDAVSAYDKGIALNSTNSEAFRKRGMAKSGLGDFKGAVADYNKAIELNPQNVNAYLQRGYAKEKLDDIKGAIKDYEEVLERDPTNENALKRLDALKAKPADNKKPDDGKKSGGLDNLISGLDKLGKDLDKITGKKPQDTPTTGDKGGKTEPTKTEPTKTEPAKTDKPTKVVEIGNTAACQFTDTAKFTLKQPVNVTQIIIWYSWKPDENTVAYKLFDSSGKALRATNFRRGASDTYQKQWAQGVDEPNMNLKAGTYTVKTANARIGQNSGTGGNGMIQVITGGYLVPPASATQTTTKPDTKTTTTAKPDTKTTTAKSPDVVKPVSVGDKCPQGWVTKTVGDVTFFMPGQWKTVPGAPKDQGAWYLGDMDAPDVGFGVMREGDPQEFISDLDVQNKADITVSGLPGTSYIGKVKGEDMNGWVIVMKNKRPDGRPLYFLGVSILKTWGTYKPVLDKVVGSVKIKGSPGAK